MQKIIINIVTTFAFIIGISIPAFSQSGDLQSIRNRALNGDPQAMIELSQYYQSNGKRDLANGWLEKAEKTSPGITARIKQDYDIDNELSQADAKAKEQSMAAMNTYLKYYDANNIHALVGIAHLYDLGWGIKRDRTEAKKYYDKALSINKDAAYRYMQAMIVWEDFNYNPKSMMFSILDDAIDKGCDNVAVILRLAQCYFVQSHSKKGTYKTNSGYGTYNAYYNVNTDYLDRSELLYQKAAKLGADDANNMLKRINELRGELALQKNEERDFNDDYRSTMQNFAGVWTCRNSYTQYKFDSKGNGWFRSGSGYVWETLGVTYKSYNCISVYDGHARHTLEVTGSTMTQDNYYRYRKRKN